MYGIKIFGTVNLQSQEFSKTREALVEAQTTRKEKFEDLSRQLQGNEEKLAVYERRPGPGSFSTR
jgi:nucleoprotein TPR